MRRLETLRENFLEKGLDAVFLHQRENVLYYTGFTGTTGGLFVTSGKAYVLVDSRYEEQAGQQCEGFEVVLSSHPWLISGMCGDCRKIGFEEDFITYEVYQILLNEIPQGATLVPAAELPKLQRAQKDDGEIEKIRTAVKIADNAFHHILPFIKEGVYEIDIANELDFYMRKQGASGPSFDFIVAGGARSAMPHGVAGRNKLQAHEPVLMDFGCIYENYCSDITRTVFLGNPADEMKALYYTVLEGQKRGYRNSLIGKQISLAETAVRAYFEELEVEQYFGHSLGHGVGLEIHEAPTVNRTGTAKFRNQMVYTIEPGLYIPGACGVRIEDTVLMTYNGPQALTEAPKDLIIL